MIFATYRQTYHRPKWNVRILQIPDKKCSQYIQEFLYCNHIKWRTSMFQVGKNYWCMLPLKYGSEWQARIQRGDWGSGPPLRFVKGGVLCRGLMVGEGVQWLFYLIIIIFSGSLCSPVLYKYITCIHASKFNVQYGAVILSVYFLYANYEKNPDSRPCFNERALSYRSCPELHDFTPFKQKKFGGRTPPHPHLPYPFTIWKAPCYLCVNVERVLQLQKTMPFWKINLNVNL